MEFSTLFIVLLSDLPADIHADISPQIHTMVHKKKPMPAAKISMNARKSNKKNMQALIQLPQYRSPSPGIKNERMIDTSGLFPFYFLTELFFFKNSSSLSSFVSAIGHSYSLVFLISYCSPLFEPRSPRGSDSIPLLRAPRSLTFVPGPCAFSYPLRAAASSDICRCAGLPWKRIMS